MTAYIFDFDHTLFKQNEAYWDALDSRIFTHAAKILGISIEEADVICTKSYMAFGSCIAGLSELGVDKEHFHRVMHEDIDYSLAPPVCSVTAQMVGRLKGQRSVLTHATHDYAWNGLAHIGMQQHFEKHLVLGLEDVNFSFKSQSVDGFLHMLDLLGMDAKEAVVVEDSITNLKYPYELGMRTVLITWERMLEVPDYVDEAYPSLLKFMDNEPKHVF